VRDVFKGTTAIYLYAFMSAAHQSKEKKKAMESKLSKLCDVDADDTYVDLQI